MHATTERHVVVTAVEYGRDYRGMAPSLVILFVACPNYAAYRRLPATVRFRPDRCGQAEDVFGLTGWDSDRGYAFYRNDAVVAAAG